MVKLKYFIDVSVEVGSDNQDLELYDSFGVYCVHARYDVVPISLHPPATMVLDSNFKVLGIL